MPKRILHRFIDGVEVKRCGHCEQWLPLGSFTKEARSWDGLYSRCRMCKAIGAAKYWEGNREERIAYGARYYAENGEKRRTYARQYHAENSEKRKAYGRQYRAANREKSRARVAKWRAENREEQSIYMSQWRARNHDAGRANNARRRARKNGADGADYTTAEHIEARKEFYGGLCYLCGALAEAMDHVIPLAKGGSHWPSNLRPICRRCNSIKNAQWPYDFDEHRKRLKEFGATDRD